MAANWWKIMVLQILITTIICSTGLEFDDDSTFSNENMASLFKTFLEDIYNQHAIKDNKKIEKIKDLHQPLSLTSLNGKYFEKFLENKLKNEDLYQSTFNNHRNIRNIRSTDNVNNKSGKKDRKINLCFFKICAKKINDDRHKFNRHVKKRYYNPK